jgi:hypothetical protein
MLVVTLPCIAYANRCLGRSYRLALIFLTFLDLNDSFLLLNGNSPHFRNIFRTVQTYHDLIASIKYTKMQFIYLYHYLSVFMSPLCSMLCPRSGPQIHFRLSGLQDMPLQLVLAMITTSITSCSTAIPVSVEHFDPCNRGAALIG